MKIENLDDVLVDELKDIYSLEQQLGKALEKMANAANGDLRLLFEEHLEQTRIHADRVQQICDQIQISPEGKKCAGLSGIVKEGEEVIKESANPDTVNVGLIGAAQRAEHYEIAAYGTARTHARQLGYTSIVKILSDTLEEEKETDRQLTSLAENSINIKAAMEKGNMDAGSSLQM